MRTLSAVKKLSSSSPDDTTGDDDTDLSLLWDTVAVYGYLALRILVALGVVWFAGTVVPYVQFFFFLDWAEYSFSFFCLSCRSFVLVFLGDTC
jgi:hypothetical protein